MRAMTAKVKSSRQPVLSSHVKGAMMYSNGYMDRKFKKNIGNDNRNAIS